MSQSETSNPNPSKRKFTKGQKVTLAIFGLIITYLIFTVAWPLLIGDGLAGYSGVPRQLAQQVMDDKRYLYLNPIERTIINKYHIDSVRPTTPEEATQYCSTDQGTNYINDPNDPRYYTVTLRVYQLFSPVSTVYIYDGCTPIHKPGFYQPR